MAAAAPTADPPATAGGELAEEPPAVLLLGEANFSFALALATRLAQQRPPQPQAEGAEAGAGAAEGAEAGTEGATDPVARFLRRPAAAWRQARLVASCYEGSDLRAQKYPESDGLIRRLVAQHAGGAEARHGVNAWDLRRSFGDSQRWDIIAWNHPHLGTEDFKLHRFLLAHFFHSAKQDLRPGGLVVLSVVQGQAERWELLRQAERQGLALACAPEPFEAMEWPGYECKRNTTGRSFKNLHSQRQATSAMRSWTYHLGRREEVPAAAAAAALASLPPSGSAAPSRPRRHREQAVGDSDPTTCRPAAAHVCGACGKEFTCAQGLRTHTRQVHELRKYGSSWEPEQEARERCPECGRGFGDLEAVRQHRLAAHDAASPGAAAAPSSATSSASPPPTSSPVASPSSAASPSPRAAWSSSAAAEAAPTEAASPASSAPEARARGARGHALALVGPMPASAQDAQTAGHGGAFAPCEVCGMAVPRGTPMEAHLEALRPVDGLSVSCDRCGRPFVEPRALEQHQRFCRGGHGAASASVAQPEAAPAPPPAAPPAGGDARKVLAPPLPGPALLWRMGLARRCDDCWEALPRLLVEAGGGRHSRTAGPPRSAAQPA